MSKHPVLLTISLCLLSLSVGFGVSQIAIVGEVKGHTIQIKHLQDAGTEERHQTDTRIFELVHLVTVVIENDRERNKTISEFMVQLRIQNDLLQKQFNKL